MLALLLVITPIGLLNGVLTLPMYIATLAAILGTAHPLPRAIAYLAGVFVVYIGGGALILLGLDAVLALLEPTIVRWWNEPEAKYLVGQILVGAVMVVVGWRLPQQAPTGTASVAMPCRCARPLCSAPA